MKPQMKCEMEKEYANFIKFIIENGMYKIAIRSNINHTRDIIYKDGYIAKAINIHNKNDFREVEIMSIDKLAQDLSKAGSAAYIEISPL